MIKTGFGIRMSKLNQALQRQLKLNERKNLLHAEVQQMIEIDTTFLAALEELLMDTSAGAEHFDLDKLSADAASALIDRIYTVNQYIQIDNEAKQSLKAIYVQSWQKLAKTRNIESTLRNDHYPRIKAFLAQLYPSGLAKALQNSPTLNFVPCSEYSAELQMRLFRLELSTITEPVLDIGCGSQAILVTYLRSHHIEAYGIDRTIKQKFDFLNEMDWFDMQLDYNNWGTIVSNLSFANHMVYAQRYEPESVPRYQKKYLEILGSLKAGGSFNFAPSVESLEILTNNKNYHTEHWSITAQHTVTKVTKMVVAQDSI
jgi:hypothetical protein